MRRVFIATLLVLFSLGTIDTAGAERIPLNVELDWGFQKDLKSNLFSTTNLHTGYNLIGYGTRAALGYNEKEAKTSFWGRTTEIAFTGFFGLPLAILGHEGGQREAALANGAEHASISMSFWSGECSYKGFLSESEKAKFFASGMAWTNRSAEEAISRNLGKRVTASELMWFGVSQLDTSRYALKTDKPPQYLGSYGQDFHDVEQWILVTGKSDYQRMNKLYDDVKLGGVWQGSGLLIPLFVGLDYWFTGNMREAPRMWLNPQSELTDAGVLYNLDYYKLFKNDVLLKARAGYGKDRVEEDGVYAAELGVSGIPLFWGMTCGAKGGISETLETNHVYGASLAKSFGDFEVELTGNHYDGYHRNNPKAEGDFNEVLFKISFEL